MINKIRVKNFKCFEAEEMLLSNLNLLSGINSMGKSTMIQALLLLRQSYEQNSMIKGIYLNGQYTNIGTGRDLLYTQAEDNVIEIGLDTETGSSKWIFEYEKDADYLKTISSADVAGENSVLGNIFDNGFTYIAADRLGPQSSYRKSRYEVWEKEQVGNHGEYAVHYLHAHELDHVKNETVLYPGEENKRLPRQVECWMGEITPGVSLRIEDFGRSNLIGLTLHQESTMASDYFSVQNVGFGLSYVLPIVLALIKAVPGDLVILENPEAHLHPRGQRKMGELIARAAQGGVQIIVETHSDHVLNGIRLSARNQKIDPEKVRLFYFTRQVERSGDASKICPCIEKPVLKNDGRLSFWPEGFFDEWDKAIEEMF